MLLFLSLMVILLIYLLTKYRLEAFDLGVPQTQVGASSMYMPQPDLLVRSTVNSLITSINSLTKNIYDSTIDMSNGIKTKLFQYAETMRTYNKSKDDEEGLKSVMINKRHKMFIDNLRSSQQYGSWASTADTFYGLPFEEQEAFIRKFLSGMKGTTTS
jgi:hypothetical protein